MKKLFRSKKSLAAAALALMLAVGGTTFAWFTSDASVPANAGMGTLYLTATADKDLADLVADKLQPGMGYEVLFGSTDPVPVTGTVLLENKGSLQLIARADTSIIIQQRGDYWGRPGYGGTGKFEINEEGSFALVEGEDPELLDDKELGYVQASIDSVESDPDAGYVWMTEVVLEEGAPRHVYLLAEAGAKNIPASFGFGLNGDEDEGMGNEFQGADISISSAWEATQGLDGAMAAKWGASAVNGNLMAVEDFASMNTFSAFSASSAVSSEKLDKIHAFIDEFFNR